MSSIGSGHLIRDLYLDVVNPKGHVSKYIDWNKTIDVLYEVFPNAPDFFIEIMGNVMKSLGDDEKPYRMDIYNGFYLLIDALKEKKTSFKASEIRTLREKLARSYLANLYDIDAEIRTTSSGDYPGFREGDFKSYAPELPGFTAKFLVYAMTENFKKDFWENLATLAVGGSYQLRAAQSDLNSIYFHPEDKTYPVDAEIRTIFERIRREIEKALSP